MSMKQLARTTEALPLGPNTFYEGNEVSFITVYHCISLYAITGLIPLFLIFHLRTLQQDSDTWDEDKVYGCVCDSSWSVGLREEETQEPEWFGPDCSRRKYY